MAAILKNGKTAILR